MSKISVVINTGNAEKHLAKTLKSVHSLADEIVVVDMKSTDKTVEIAKREGVKVYEFQPLGYVEPARNFAIEKATHEWIFILDADEEATPELIKKLKKIVASKNPADFYRIPRKNIIFRKWIRHSRWWPDYNIRFFKKGAVTWSEIIHSVPETRGKGIDLPAKEDLAILHHHYDSIEQFIDRMNFYTTKHAELLRKDGYKFSWQDLVKKPTNEFLSRYFFGKGYKDGLHGLALAGLQAFSEFVLYLKVWQAEKFREEKLGVEEVIGTMKETESEVHYWQADTLLREGGTVVSRLKQKIKRKLKI